MSRLTPRQERFVEEYLVDLNATQAAIRAGYTKRHADVVGSRLLGKVRIQETLTRRRRELATAHDVTPERVIGEMARLAFADLGEFVRIENGKMIVQDFTQADGTKLDTRCLAEVSETITEHGGTLKVKLHNKREALRDLGEHLGIFEAARERTLSLEAVVIAHDGAARVRVSTTPTREATTPDTAFDVVLEP